MEVVLVGSFADVRVESHLKQRDCRCCGKGNGEPKRKDSSGEIGPQVGETPPGQG